MDEVKVESVEVVAVPVVNVVVPVLPEVKRRGVKGVGVTDELLRIVDTMGPIKSVLIASVMSEKFPGRNMKKSIASLLSLLKKHGRVEKSPRGWKATAYTP